MVRLGIALLCAAAVVLIAVILTSGRYDDESAKAFATAVAIAFVSLTIAPGVNLIARQPGIAPIGYLTILAGIVALAATANLIWSHSPLENSDAARTAGYALIAAFALGNTSALLAGHDDDDVDSVKLVRIGTVVMLWALAITIIAEIHVSGQTVDPRQIGITAALYALGAAVLPLLRRVDG